MPLAIGTDLTETCPDCRCHCHLGALKDVEKLGENVLFLYQIEPDHCPLAGVSVTHTGVARSKKDLQGTTPMIPELGSAERRLAS